MTTALLCGRDQRGQERLQEVLSVCGIQAVLLSQDLETAYEIVQNREPDLMMVEVVQLQTALDRFVRMRSCCSAPLILLGGEQEQEMLQNYADHGDALLLTPLPPVRTAAVVQLALVSARRTAALRQALQEARIALSERKQIERAKGLVMVSEGLSEEQAYRRMRSQAMSRRISMARLAGDILQQNALSG